MLNCSPDRHVVLIVDDEPDIALVTKLGLKNLRYRDRPLEFISAASGQEAIDQMRRNPDIAVILLDVVMETDTAGLDACRVIRKELQNHCVRILLRTGQPGTAPEKQTIDAFDSSRHGRSQTTTDRDHSRLDTSTADRSCGAADPAGGRVEGRADARRIGLQYARTSGEQAQPRRRACPHSMTA